MKLGCLTVFFLFLTIMAARGEDISPDSTVCSNNDSAICDIPDTITPIIQKYFHFPLRADEFMTYQAKLDSVCINDSTQIIHIYASDEFSFWNFTQERVNTIYSDIQSRLPANARKYRLEIISNGNEISRYIANYKHDFPADSSRLWGNIDYKGTPWTKNISHPFNITQGLYNRHLVVWPSHGMYWMNEQGKWAWQRPALFCTTEDMFTLSIVTPFLLPMLENSGAICYVPRERDWQTEEIIIDNDDPQSGFTEINGSNYWHVSPHEGFMNSSAYYSNNSPFLRFPWNVPNAPDSLQTDSITSTPAIKGSSLMVETATNGDMESSCCWMPNIKKEGRYAVYVTYQSFPNSTTQAVYKIIHKGIATLVSVNQTMGGGTWVYLGTYDFGMGKTAENAIYLNNITNEEGKVISVDAVRLGGGMGNIVRDDDGETDFRSQMPRFLEGARYYCQYSGLPLEVYDTKDSYNDYADDINCRSNALNWLSGGSIYHPDTVGCKVPFELSLGIHSDAGYRPDNDIYGSLVISTLKNDTLGEYFSNGISRMASSDFADMMQQTICHDMSHYLHRTWYTREHLRKNYSETRKPEVPSAILETLSHQNFSDMLLGHDPNVKFLLARSIYKSILKFISYQHGVNYTVHPLPVDNFATMLTDSNKVKLTWTPRIDPLEKTATPTGYIIYTKCGSKGYDNGILVKNACEYVMDILPDSIYSFKITAINSGGESFPSEELAVFKSSQETAQLLIVNGFTRLSSPAVINTSKSLGFSLAKDYGVPYIKTPEYCGDQIEYQRNKRKTLGKSNTDMQGGFIIGNTFNYPLIHGQSISSFRKVSYASSCLNALINNNIQLNTYNMVDLILGLQKDNGKSSIYSYKTFGTTLQKKLSAYIRSGGHLLATGAYIGSDQTSQADTDFALRTLKYKYNGHAADGTNTILIKGTDICAEFETLYNQESYAVQHPERILPFSTARATIQFSDGSTAGITDQKVFITTIPFEAIKEKHSRNAIMQYILSTLLRM